MSRKEALKIFENENIRVVWDDEREEWYFSVVDVCGVLTDQPDYDRAKNYWKVLKFRLVKEGNESVTNCNQLKLVSPKDGKRYNTDVANTEQLFRIIQSIPSSKAEPFKQWMAQVAADRLNQMTNVELLLNSLAEASATEISKQENPKGYGQNADVARRGGRVARAARNQLESQLGHSVVTSLNAKDYFKSIEQEGRQQIEGDNETDKLKPI